MNQILSVEPQKTKKEKKEKKQKRQKKQNYNFQYSSNKSGPVEIEKITKIFAIALIIFGIIMIGSGSYSMFQETKVDTTDVKPTISVQEISETQLKIQITHTSTLQRATYNWTGEEPVQLNAAGKRNVEQIIEIPTGENTLNIYALDGNGKETNYSKMYTRQGDINIDFSVDGANLIVSASGANELSYMTYRWDEEDEQRVDINALETEQTIEIPQGEHTITVSVVDVNNTMETKDQKVKGIIKPTLSIGRTENNFVITASDEEGLTRMEIIIDGNSDNPYLIDLEKAYPNIEDRKQFEYSGFELHDGENTMEVTVYNESGASESNAVLVNK